MGRRGDGKIERGKRKRGGEGLEERGESWKFEGDEEG